MQPIARLSGLPPLPSGVRELLSRQVPPRASHQASCIAHANRRKHVQHQQRRDITVDHLDSGRDREIHFVHVAFVYLDLCMLIDV